ncbi:hypothetical protein NHQ30_004532 [Ciborinia camelliae]|nr:hypothetical protein NHQ30_004532 [Ciborinia camelliae]
MAEKSLNVVIISTGPSCPNPRAQSSLSTDESWGRIAAMEHVQSFIERYDLTKTPYSVTSPNVQFLDQAVKIKSTWNISVAMTSWQILYYLVRANFDDLASDICPQPPKLAGQLGSAIYEHGKEATDVEYKDGVHADLVIAADGASSKVRQTLQPNLKHKYAGYVVWRRTAPESEVSEKTKAIFACKTIFFPYKGGYIVLYTIPGEDGNTSPGHRQLNWVWYNACPENSQEFVEVMTDVDGHRHRTTLPIGKVDPQNWEKQKALALEILPSPFAEMIQKTNKAFISAIYDREIAKPEVLALMEDYFSWGIRLRHFVHMWLPAPIRLHLNSRWNNS